MGRPQEAYDKIMHELASVSSPAAAAELYQGLASLYEEEGNHELRAIAVEKALEARPEDTSMRFNAAYSFSEKGFAALALLHYSTLRRFKPDHATALNNR